MRLILLIFLTTFFSSITKAQTSCAFVADTCFLPKEGKTVPVESMKATFKNFSEISLLRTPDNKFYLRLIVTENLYFDKVDMLELKSGSKSFYAKQTKQYQHTKHTGSYVIEIWKNYLVTLKDDGLTGILFGTAESKFYKSDSRQVKAIAECFYNEIDKKEKK